MRRILSCLRSATATLPQASRGRNETALGRHILPPLRNVTCQRASSSFSSLFAVEERPHGERSLGATSSSAGNSSDAFLTSIPLTILSKEMENSKRQVYSTGNFRCSPRKLNQLAQLIRGKTVEEALVQLQFSHRGPARRVAHALYNARAAAIHNLGANPEELFVKEAFVGKGLVYKMLDIKGRARMGIQTRPTSHLKFVLLSHPTANKPTHFDRLVKYMKRRKLDMPLDRKPSAAAPPPWKRTNPPKTQVTIG
ncbi:ribosomal protein L22 [Gonapodya prolifera JEL478]|uniref:Ribosomal protein L22 n=1 Tax=Gonapodya prolifera (strain JEL478) TaxID=1344416 RepID=A0A139AND6_GONPJ|nr:ribosomal protein L22 [Gonapodya prolifera JEL478]|eukprot:KXS18257.1 ribosomal protein L22 [Gonapodya prolifera JEL478]